MRQKNKSRLRNVRRAQGAVLNANLGRVLDAAWLWEGKGIIQKTHAAPMLSSTRIVDKASCVLVRASRESLSNIRDYSVQVSALNLRG